MSANKKAQAMVIDLILLVLIATIIFVFLSSQVENKSSDTGIIRSQSSYIQRLLISTLQYEVSNGTYQNATVAELLGRHLCNEGSFSSQLNTTVNEAINSLGKDNNYFIFISKTSTKTVAVYNNESCVRTEHINLAIAELDMPCSKTAEITLGTWPTSQEVETC